MDANPLNRPAGKEVEDIVYRWCYKFDEQIELKKQVKEAEEINNNLSSSNTTLPNSLALSYETHSEAIYTSRLLNFNNLPEQKNSDDYYKRNDNIISEEYSGN